MIKIMMITAVAACALAIGDLKADALFSTDDGELHSTVISLSRAAHGWLYQYANSAIDIHVPGASVVGFAIWPDHRFKVIKFWEPSDDATEGK
jgi:hypothetical protein